MKISETELDKLFTLYLDTALVEFETPHSKTELEILEVYRNSFNKVVGDYFDKGE